MNASRERYGSLVTGGGTTMFAVGRAIRRGELNMDFGCVVASRPGIGAEEKAYDLDVPYELVDRDNFRGDDGKVDQYGFGQEIIKRLRKHGVTIVSQNGWLPRTPKNVIEAFPDSIYNQHPGPKEETKATHGTQPHAIMLYVARHTGRNAGTEVIIHRVDEKWDHGKTVAKTPVQIYLPYDHPKRLQQRALHVEHELQITHWRNVLTGNVHEVADTEYMKPGEQYILDRARAYARRVYPNG